MCRLAVVCHETATGSGNDARRERLPRRPRSAREPAPFRRRPRVVEPPASRRNGRGPIIRRRWPSTIGPSRRRFGTARRETTGEVARSGTVPAGIPVTMFSRYHSERSYRQALATTRRDGRDQWSTIYPANSTTPAPAISQLLRSVRPMSLSEPIRRRVHHCRPRQSMPDMGIVIRRHCSPWSGAGTGRWITITAGRMPLPAPESMQPRFRGVRTPLRYPAGCGKVTRRVRRGSAPITRPLRPPRRRRGP